jgi:hypothetical protein
MSNINPAWPIFGTPTTQSVRDNFGVAKAEIEALEQGKADRTELATYLPLAGGTLTGPLMLSRDPQSGLEAATRSYADGLPFLPLAGGRMTGALFVAEPEAPDGAASRRYVDAGLSALDGAMQGRFLPLAGGTLTGPLRLAADPVAPQEAVSQGYVDRRVSEVAGITEAPLDGRTFGRRARDWTEALPMTGGTLTGLLVAPELIAPQIWLRGERDFGLYGGDVFRLLQFGSGWTDAWEIATGTRSWNAPGRALMTLDPAGNLRVTGGAYAAELTSHGGVHVAGLVYVDGAGVAFRGQGRADVHAQLWDGMLQPIVNGSGGIGHYQLTGSDARTKQNVRACGDALADLRRLDVVSFERILHVGGHEYRRAYDFGLIADDVERIAPDAVIVPDDPAMMRSLDLLPLMGRCIRAIQQLADRIDLLEPGETEDA